MKSVNKIKQVIRNHPLPAITAATLAGIYVGRRLKPVSTSDNAFAFVDDFLGYVEEHGMVPPPCKIEKYENIQQLFL